MTHPPTPTCLACGRNPALRYHDTLCLGCAWSYAELRRLEPAELARTADRLTRRARLIYAAKHGVEALRVEVGNPTIGLTSDHE